MNHFAHFAANAYATVDISTAVSSASQHQLTLMLYDAALKHMDKAGQHLRAGQIAEKGMAITRAIRIVEEGLKGTLDLSYGELPLTLKSLYEYVSNCLLKANLRNDAALLADARSLLAGMRDTWAAIAPRPGAPAAPPLRASGEMPMFGVAAA